MTALSSPDRVGDRVTWRPTHFWRPTGFGDNRGSHFVCSRCGAMAYSGGSFPRRRPPEFSCSAEGKEETK